MNASAQELAFAPLSAVAESIRSKALSPVELVRASLRARGRSLRIVHPGISLDRGLSSPALLLQLHGAIGELGGDVARLPAALEAARRPQAAYAVS